jgi:hypothetical protein
MLFQQVFRSFDDEEGVDPHEFFVEAVEAGLGECELRVVSDDPDFLAIPWELMRDASEGFLGQKLSGIVRQPVDSEPVTRPLDPAGPFRVLLVTPRPNGARQTAPSSHRSWPPNWSAGCSGCSCSVSAVNVSTSFRNRAA